MESLPQCPKCGSSYTYLDQEKFNCPECAHIWEEKTENAEQEFIYKDANGNILQDGDSVSLIKDLKIKGTSKTIKVGTKVKNIKLVDSDHDIDCKVEGFGRMKLKSEFVKKV